MMADWEIKGFMYASRTALAESEYALRPTVHSWRAILPDVLTVKKGSVSMLPFSCREIHRSCKALRPSILRSHAGRYPLSIRGHHLHFAVHHDRPISASFLDRRRGREKLNKESGTIEGREEAYDLEHHRIRPSEGFRQTCTSQVFSSSVSQLSCGQLAREGVA